MTTAAPYVAPPPFAPTKAEIVAYAEAYDMWPAFKYIDTERECADRAEYEALLADKAPDDGMRNETPHEFESRVKAAMKHRAMMERKRAKEAEIAASIEAPVWS